MPTAIGEYLNPVPLDPGAYTYIWIDNRNDGSIYCVYATLDIGGYLVGSPDGIIERTIVPTLYDCN